MAIAFDAATALQSNPGTTLTYAHTVGSVSKRYLIVMAYLPSGFTVSSITFNGVTMTQIDTTSTAAEVVYLFGLSNPPVGANNVVVTASGATPNMYSRAASYSGVRQVTTVDNHGVNNGASVNTISQSITPLRSGCWLVGLLTNDGSNTVTPNTGTTLRPNSTAASIALADSNGSIVPPASTGLGYSWGGAPSTATAVVASLAPSEGDMLSCF